MTAFLQAKSDPRVMIEGTVSKADNKYSCVFAAADLQTGEFFVRIHVADGRGYS